MRIVLDARSYFMRTGIARYTRGLVQALTAKPGPHEWLVLISDHHRPDELTVPGTVRQSRAPWLGGEAEREVLTEEADAFGADVFHAVFPPHALPRVPTLTTVFDFSPLSHPELHQQVVREAFAEAWASADAHAAGFVAVSQATADDVRRRVGDTRRVWVLPCGLSAPFDGGMESELADVSAPAERTGVVCVGTIEPRKNIATLLEASRRLSDTGRRIPVTLVGKRGWGYEAFDRDLAATPDATWIGYVDDKDLLARYRQAAIAVCPSRLEGFGLPTLEAMAQGALPLVSPDPALLELVGHPDLAVPLDASAWAEAIARWLDDDAGRRTAVRETRARARLFTWPAIAERCLPVYDALR